MESHSHLFFVCQLSSRFWLNIRDRCGLSPHAWDLNSEVQCGISNCKGSSVQSLLFKISLSASIYSIWKERNGRIFQQVGHDCATVEKLIVEEVKSCTAFISC
ncbi:hypothetical protein RHMOL_Rhmol08G0181300 [Rhododendron molle]|uniref:Uncharacterized protein n=1 Tax=Rhododendron molle TaxID=49168 RepID=A0ACC0MPL7_RHOML|nr:hypothetical protein RHMOL_Rhmol08G0181300 [Rhododendron molle]